MKEIVAATNNQGKVREIESALKEHGIKVLPLQAFKNIPEAIEDGKTFRENAILKATHYAKSTKHICLADDSGLEVDALGGAPGVYSARYAGILASDAENNEKLLAELKNVQKENRTARFRCVLALVEDNNILYTADGVCEGIILDAPRGQGGFGYDPLFFIPSLGKTLAELTLDEKNAVSHRGQALCSLSNQLAGDTK